MATTTRSHPRRRAALAACLLLLAPLAACSDGDDEPAATTTTEAPGDGSTTTTGDDGPETTETTETDGTTTTSEAGDPEPEPAEGEQAYVGALVTAFVSEENTDLPLDQEQAECIAPKWVSAIGVDRFADGGITPEDLVEATEDSYFDLIDGIGDPDTAEELAGAFAECDLDLTELIAGLLTADGSTTPEQASCFVDAVPDGAVEASLASALDGDPESEADFDDEIEGAATACFE